MYPSLTSDDGNGLEWDDDAVAHHQIEL